MSNPFSFLTPKVVFGAMVVCIISLSGVVITLSQSHVKVMIEEALKCSNFAPSEAVAQMDKKKLDVDRYEADQKTLDATFRDINNKILGVDSKVEKLDRGVNKLIDLNMKSHNKIMYVPSPFPMMTTVPPTGAK